MPIGTGPIGKAAAIAEAEKLDLKTNAWYYALLGHLYTGLNDDAALAHYRQALALLKPGADTSAIEKHIQALAAHST